MSEPSGSRAFREFKRRAKVGRIARLDGVTGRVVKIFERRDEYHIDVEGEVRKVQLPPHFRVILKNDQFLLLDPEENPVTVVKFMEEET